jgi:hypothetical protein
MRVISGDEFGIIKECIIPGKPNKNTKAFCSNEAGVQQRKITILYKPPAPSRSQGVVSISQLPSTDHRSSFAALLMDGSVHTYQSNSDSDDSIPATVISKLTNIFESKKDGTITFPSQCIMDTALPVGMGTITAPSKDDQILVACNAQGHVALIKKSRMDHQCSVVTRYQDIIPMGTSAANPKNQNYITAFATSSIADTCAIGGRNQPIHVFCLETGKTIWKSKNVKPSLITLLDDPVWTTALQFVYDESNLNHKDLLVAGSAYKQIQLYDIRAQRRRPTIVSPKSLLNYRVTSLLTKNASGKDAVIVGDASGGVYSLDLRKMNTVLHRYVGPVGSVRSISTPVTDEINPYITCVGLDRYLRVFDVARPRKSMHDIYLKQRLNCCISYADDPNIDHDEEDDFFNFADRKEVAHAASTKNEGMDQDDMVADYRLDKDVDGRHDTKEDDTSSSCSTSTVEDCSVDGSYSSSNENEDCVDSSQDSSNTSAPEYDEDDEGSCESENDSSGTDIESDEDVEYEDPFAPTLKKSLSRRKPTTGIAPYKRPKLNK